MTTHKPDLSAALEPEIMRDVRLIALRSYRRNRRRGDYADYLQDALLSVLLAKTKRPDGGALYLFGAARNGCALSGGSGARRRQEAFRLCALPPFFENYPDKAGGGEFRQIARDLVVRFAGRLNPKEAAFWLGRFEDLRGGRVLNDSVKKKAFRRLLEKFAAFAAASARDYDSPGFQLGPASSLPCRVSLLPEVGDNRYKKAVRQKRFREKKINGII